VCGSLCMLALLLVILLLTRKREGFASFDTKLTVIDAELPDPDNPDKKLSTTFRVDVSGNSGTIPINSGTIPINSGTIPISISNLSELSGASPSSLKGKNLPQTIDDMTKVTANKMKAETDTMAEMRRIARKEIQDARRFDTEVIDDEYEESVEMNSRNSGCCKKDNCCDY